MFDRVYRVLGTFRSTLTIEQQRIVRVLGVLAFIMLAGLTITGVWQFFAHKSVPSWFDHAPGSGARQQTTPSTGAAAAHSLFSTFGGIVALAGGGWYAYKVSFSVPWLWLFGLSLSLFGSFTGSLIRFNAIKLPGQSYQDAGVGYSQLFLGDVEFVVTDRWDLGATAIRLMTLSHTVTVPILLFAVWACLPRIADPNR